MEIATSYRKEKILDGAKDKRIASADDESTHDDKIPKKAAAAGTEHIKDKQIAAATEVESNCSNIFELEVRCSDKVIVDAKPFLRESKLFRALYDEGAYGIYVESKGEIIQKIADFCEQRANIQNHYADNKVLVQKELIKYYSKFRKDNKHDALNLIIAAFDLEIKSLIYLMMEDATEIITFRMTPAEVDKLFPTNMKGDCDIILYGMSLELRDYEWAFQKPDVLMIEDDCTDTRKAKENTDWDLELLKVPYRELHKLYVMI